MISGVLRPELAHDVLPHFRRCRRRERDRRRVAEVLAHLLHAEVARAEVVPPLAHAVRLVHREEGDADRGDALERAAEVEALRGDVEHLQLAALRAREAVGDLARGERGVQEGRREPARRERVHLVLHERDQRGDDDGQLRQEQRRHLVAERLPAAGGEHDERVPAGEHRRDRALLPRPEVGEAEPVAQQRARVGERRERPSSALRCALRAASRRHRSVRRRHVRPRGRSGRA